MNINGNAIFLKCDFLGNVYLVHNDAYYCVAVDGANIELVKLSNIDYFKQNFQDNMHLMDSLSRKTLESSCKTLKGKTVEHIDTETFEGDYTSFDTSFVEQKFYTLSTVNNCNNNCEDDEDEINPYYFNGISDQVDEGISFADILMTAEGSFDTIVMKGDKDSTHVLASIEATNDYCTRRLTIYTAGIFKLNLVGESITFYKLNVNDDEQISLLRQD